MLSPLFWSVPLSFIVDDDGDDDDDTDNNDDNDDDDDDHDDEEKKNHHHHHHHHHHSMALEGALLFFPKWMTGRALHPPRDVKWQMSDSFGHHWNRFVIFTFTLSLSFFDI